MAAYGIAAEIIQHGLAASERFGPYVRVLMHLFHYRRSADARAPHTRESAVADGPAQRATVCSYHIIFRFVLDLLYNLLWTSCLNQHDVAFSNVSAGDTASERICHYVRCACFAVVGRQRLLSRRYVKKTDADRLAAGVLRSSRAAIDARLDDWSAALSHQRRGEPAGSRDQAAEQVRTELRHSLDDLRRQLQVIYKVSAVADGPARRAA